MIFDLALNEIDSGIKGENVGLSLGLPRTQEFIPGIQPGTIYLIGGSTGSGKSMFAMNNFIYTPYDDYIKNHKDTMNLKIFVYSAEMSKSALGIRAINRQIYLQFNKIIDTSYVLSRGKNKISGEIYDKILSLKGYFDKMSEYIEVFSNENPTGIRNTMLKYINDNGKTFNKQVVTNDGPKEIFDYYRPNKRQLVLGVSDHLGIIKRERKFNKKENIDKFMDYQIELRDKFGASFVDIQQLNRSLGSTDRMKLDAVSPTLDDFKQTSDTTDAANYVLTIFSPQRHELPNFRGYNINKKDGGLGDRFRAISILKNREGAADKIVGTAFIGECGLIKELPKSDEMERKHYDAINNIKKIT